MTGRHTNVHLSFLVVGHTKFAPDWCFGLFKCFFERTEVGSLRAVADVVQWSAKCNETQLVMDERGTEIVPTYDWVSCFAPRLLRSLPTIRKGHHFRFSLPIQVSSTLPAVRGKGFSDNTIQNCSDF